MLVGVPVFLGVGPEPMNDLAWISSTDGPKAIKIHTRLSMGVLEKHFSLFKDDFRRLDIALHITSFQMHKRIRYTYSRPFIDQEKNIL